MLQATLQDEFGNSLSGEFDGWSSPLKKAYNATTDFVSDKAKSAGRATAGTYKKYLDKVCPVVNDPRVQATAAAASLSPEPYSQAAGRATQGAGMACGVLRPPKAPSYGPEQNPLPSQGGTYGQWPPAAIAAAAAASKAHKAALTVAKAPSLPSGSIATFDPKRGAFRIAVPAGLSGFGAEAAFTEVGTKADPGGALLVDLKTFEKETGTAKPFFKKPLVLAGIGAGVLVLGVGGYMLARR